MNKNKKIPVQPSLLVAALAAVGLLAPPPALALTLKPLASVYKPVSNAPARPALKSSPGTSARPGAAHPAPAALKKPLASYAPAAAAKKPATANNNHPGGQILIVMRNNGRLTPAILSSLSRTAGRRLSAIVSYGGGEYILRVQGISNLPGLKTAAARLRSNANLLRAAAYVREKPLYYTVQPNRTYLLVDPQLGRFITPGGPTAVPLPARQILGVPLRLSTLRQQVRFGGASARLSGADNAIIHYYDSQFHMTIPNLDNLHYQNGPALVNAGTAMGSPGIAPFWHADPYKTSGSLFGSVPSDTQVATVPPSSGSSPATTGSNPSASNSPDVPATFYEAHFPKIQIPSANLGGSGGSGAGNKSGSSNASPGGASASNDTGGGGSSSSNDTGPGSNEGWVPIVFPGTPAPLPSVQVPAKSTSSDPMPVITFPPEALGEAPDPNPIIQLPPELLGNPPAASAGANPAQPGAPTDGGAPVSTILPEPGPGYQAPPPANDGLPQVTPITPDPNPPASPPADGLPPVAPISPAPADASPPPAAPAGPSPAELSGGAMGAPVLDFSVRAPRKTLRGNAAAVTPQTRWAAYLYTIKRNGIIGFHIPTIDSAGVAHGRDLYLQIAHTRRAPAKVTVKKPLARPLARPNPNPAAAKSAPAPAPARPAPAPAKPAPGGIFGGQGSLINGGS